MRIRTGVLSMLVAFAIQPILVVYNIYGRWESTDVPMHIIGGFTVGLLAAGVINYAKLPRQPKWFSFLFTAAFVVMVGAGWEILEYVFYSQTGDRINFGGLTVRDMLGDLINDGIGAVIAWYFFIRNKYNS